MRSHRLFRRLRGVFVLAALASLLGVGGPAQAAPWDGSRNTFASLRFERIWRDADLAVQQGRTSRSWTWGPRPWFDYREIYAQAPNGLRLVQYFDKARMEITNPDDTRGLLGGVTNGLLTVELVAGRVKLGDGIGDDQNLWLGPSRAPVAGDLPSLAGESPITPSYPSFRAVATIDNGYRDPDKTGQRVGATMDQGGGVGFEQRLADLPGTEIVVYEQATGHNIPRVFNDFLNAGPVPALAAFGYPISDAYWVRAMVGGVERRVLVQLFERRTLTYTPENPLAFQVEMGNVGQHYFAWRYPRIGKPWAVGDPALPITFAQVDGSAISSVSQIHQPGQPTELIGTPAHALIPSSVLGFLESGLPASYRVVYGDTTAYTGKRQLALLLPQAPMVDWLRISDHNDYEPAISPDGALLAFVSDRDGNPELYLMTTNGPYSLAPLQLTFTEDCVSSHPSWLPDGSGLAYESSCAAGNFEIYRAALRYEVDGRQGGIAGVRPIHPGQDQVARLTNNQIDDRWPSVSPNGREIAFFSARDGDTEIYLIASDGSRETQLTSNDSRDEAPAWGDGGRSLVFNSDRDGDHEIFMLGRDGGAAAQLTFNEIDDGYAVWGP